MKDKTFKPLLCPNDEIDLNSLSYPLLASTKLDGCRLLFKQREIVTRSLKALPNKQLNEKFEPLRKFSEEGNLILDGEVFAPGIPFQFIVSCFMTEDYDAKQSIKKWTELCQEHDYFISRQEVFDKLKFYCFDCLTDENLPFQRRIGDVEYHSLRQDIVLVKHIRVSNVKEVESYFEQVLKDGYEGLILRNPSAYYKYGRCTVKEGIAYKLKPWVTIDSKIIGFVQATQVNDDAEKTINELGRSRTSKKQEDRHTIDKAQAFVVDFNGKELSVPIAMTDEKKEYIWKHREEYLGKYVEYKYMNVGMKDLPRIPKFIRLREDK
jgi:DNA ligase-1